MVKVPLSETSTDPVIGPSHAHFSDLLRAANPERHLCNLFLDEDTRNAAHVLHVFDSEINRIPDLVSEPMPGEIRLQWWREVLDGSRNGEAAANPLAFGLLEVIRKHNLPIPALMAYLDAREFDLYHDPMGDMAMFEGYCGETSSLWFQLIAIVKGLQSGPQLADACGHAGMVLGTLQVLEQLPKHNHRQQCYLPQNVLAAAGLSSTSWLAATSQSQQASSDQQAQEAVLNAMLGLVREHWKLFHAAIEKLPAEAGSVFMPLAFAKSLLGKIEARGLNSYRIEKPGPLKRQWIVWRAGIAGLPKQI